MLTGSLGALDQHRRKHVPQGEAMRGQGESIMLLVVLPMLSARGQASTNLLQKAK